MSKGLDITTADQLSHLLPGIGKIEWIYDKENRLMVINVDGVEVKTLRGDDAELANASVKCMDLPANEENFIIKLSIAGFGIDISELMAHTREREIVEKRQLLMWYLHTHEKISTKRVGRLMGGFDHATVSHAKKTVVNLMRVDKSFRAKAERFCTQVSGITLNPKK